MGKTAVQLAEVAMSQTKLVMMLITFATSISTAAAQPAKGVDRYGDPLPAGAIARLGTVRFRHDQPVRQIHYSADGKSLLGDAPNYSSESFGGGARVWDVRTGQELA